MPGFLIEADVANAEPLKILMKLFVSQIWHDVQGCTAVPGHGCFNRPTKKRQYLEARKYGSCPVLVVVVVHKLIIV